MNNQTNCPKCDSDWVGGPIPQGLNGYHGISHYKREIGIDGSRLGIYDGLVAIRCPDCKEEFPVSSDPIHLKLFKEYKKV